MQDTENERYDTDASENIEECKDDTVEPRFIKFPVNRAANNEA